MGICSKNKKLNMLRITILIDNYIKVQELVAEHGISFLIEDDDGMMLFDTGQSRNFLDNALKLGIDLKGIDCIALSHGHYDHTGGLMPLLEHIDKKIDIYAHPDIFGKKYAKVKEIEDKNNYRYIGMPFDKEKYESKKADFKLYEEKIEIKKDITLIGQISSIKDKTGLFYEKKGEHFVADRLMDDNSVLIQTQGPAILLLGCAHSGLLDILDKVISDFEIKNGIVIIGGLHLVDHDQSELEQIADRLYDYDIKEIIPCHCTGIDGYSVLKSFFKDRCSLGEVARTYIVR